MNGTEQAQRHTAVSRVEKRVDDAEILVMQLAQTVVEDREGVQRQMRELVDSVNGILQDGHAQQKTYIDHADQQQASRIDMLFTLNTIWASKGFWQRLRWLFLGR